jgi:hypothetical protein
MALCLLCDETVGREQFFPRLEEDVTAYHVLDQSDLGSGVAADDAIRSFAVEHGLNVFTNDLHFLEPTFATGDAHPGVVFYDETATVEEVIRALRVVQHVLDSDTIQDNGLVLRVPGTWGPD